ncbi:MAG: beta-lactamase hydrolase domain-containing protein, partial [Halioglobus sp.]
MTLEIKQVSSTLSVSGQIGVDDGATLAAQGVRSLICNRPDGEAPDQPNVAEIEAAAVAAGIELAFLPVVTSALNEQNVTDFLGALDQLPRPVHAYCR